MQEGVIEGLKEGLLNSSLQLHIDIDYKADL